VIALWGWYAAFAIDESKPLARVLSWGSCEPGPASKRIRVVTFNCGSSAAAAEEAFQQKPDLILFQESPQRHVLERLADEHLGENADVLWSPDVSLVARGQLKLGKQSHKGVWTWATWRHDGVELEVVNLRLAPVPLRFDFWTLDCWRSLTRVRERHRLELAEVLLAMGEAPGAHRCLIGGDFNAPARDACLAELKPTFQDAFNHAGVGWGNTITNDFPVHRIDQLWTNSRLQAIEIRAVSSHSSDHRLITGEFVVK
jgi:hypothetical protein